jgi:hypothetical protein
MDQAMTDHFVDDVLSCLTATYTVSDGSTIQGAAISYLIAEMRDYDKRWRGLGSLGDFEYLLEQQGFRVVQGRNARGNHARVVTV